MRYELLDNEALSKLLAVRTDLAEADAHAIVTSTDPLLGRGWAIGRLQAMDTHAARSEQLDQHAENIGRAISAL